MMYLKLSHISRKICLCILLTEILLIEKTFSFIDWSDETVSPYPFEIAYLIASSIFLFSIYFANIIDELVYATDVKILYSYIVETLIVEQNNFKHL